MKFRKITAIVLGATIMAASSTAVFAESVPVQTATVQQELGASAVKTWDGKTALKAGESYVLKKNATISKKVEIPKGTTLTINKGVKLGIAAKGSLYIRGTLALKSGSTLSVSGKLYTYSGSKISDTGSIKLNTNKANVTIGGTFTVNKGGSVSGTPKTIKLGKKAKVTVKGKNTCKKLEKLLGDSSENSDIQEIEKMLNGVYQEILDTGSLFNALKKAVPASYIEKAEKEFVDQIKELDTTGEMADMTLGDFVDSLFGALLDEALSGIESIKLSVVKAAKYDKELTDEQKMFFEGCKKIESVYLAEIKPDIKYKDGFDPAAIGAVVSDDTTELVVVKADGKWYLCSQDIL